MEVPKEAFHSIGALAMCALAALIPVNITITSNSYLWMQSTVMELHPYEDVKSLYIITEPIKTEPQNERPKPPYHFVVFKDWTTWNSQDGEATPKGTDFETIKNYLESRTGMKTQFIDSRKDAY